MVINGNKIIFKRQTNYSFVASYMFEVQRYLNLSYYVKLNLIF